jgi:AraC family transcriptional regulator
VSELGTRRPPISPPGDGPPASAGSKAYGHALARAGGNEVLSLARSADRNAIHVGLYSAPAYDLKVPALPVARLSVPLTYSRITGALEDDPVRAYHAPRHSVFLTPANTAAQWSKDRSSRHLNIYFHSLAFDGDLREEGRLDEAAASRINTALERVLPGLRGIADELTAELQHPDAFSAEAVDCLARLLLVRLASLQARLAQSHSPITPLMLERVKDFVQSSLSEKILVGQMASVAGMPASRFAHAFTKLTGQAPHQYVLTQRLDMAASLLARSRLSVADVAATCGFASQQHLTNRMRSRLGTTPAQYRAHADLGAERSTFQG